MDFIEWSVAIDALMDEATIGTLFAKVGTVVAVEVRASSDAVSATNPSYQGDALLTECGPINGGVGEANTVSLALVSAGPLSRVTTAP